MRIALLVLILLAGCSPYMPATPTPSQEPTTTATTVASQQAISTLTATPLPSCQVATGIEAGRVNLRSGPGTGNAAIGLLHEGEAVTVIERGAWLKVETSQRVTGWVNSKFCR